MPSAQADQCFATYGTTMVAIQVLGALTPVVTAALAYALMGTMERPTTYAALLPVMLGIIMATGYEISFSATGVACAVGGCFARALKTVLQVDILLVLNTSLSWTCGYCESSLSVASSGSGYCFGREDCLKADKKMAYAGEAAQR